MKKNENIVFVLCNHFIILIYFIMCVYQSLLSYLHDNNLFIYIFIIIRYNIFVALHGMNSSFVIYSSSNLKTKEYKTKKVVIFFFLTYCNNGSTAKASNFIYLFFLIQFKFFFFELTNHTISNMIMFVQIPTFIHYDPSI